MVTRDGWLYDKEAILKYILEKKEDYRRKQKAFEAQTSREFKELHKNAEKDLEKQKEFFEKQEQVCIFNWCYENYDAHFITFSILIPEHLLGQEVFLIEHFAFLGFDNPLVFFVIIFEAGAAGLLGTEPHAVGRRHEAEEAGQDNLLGSVH